MTTQVQRRASEKDQQRVLNMPVSESAGPTDFQSKFVPQIPWGAWPGGPFPKAGSENHPTSGLTSNPGLGTGLCDFGDLT